MSNTNPNNRIPLFNVHMPADIDTKVAEVLHSGGLANGPSVGAFEALLSEYIGNPNIVVTADISTSLSICLFLAGVRPDDEVAMSPLVCLATSTPVRNLFANIRWCDVDPDSGNMDPADLERKITAKTKAVVVYHWAGNPAELAPIQALARSRGIAVIEDASEALGADYRGRLIGATGSDFAVFSFYANRQLTTIEGGAIACHREADLEKARWLKRYGIHQPTFRLANGEIDPYSDIPVAGWNCSMDHVAATIGLAQMGHVRRIVARHRENGRFFDERLADLPGIQVLKRAPDSTSAYWVYTLFSDKRDGLLEYLHREGIGASKVHIRNDIYTAFGPSQGDLPGVESFSRRHLSIPCGWWVSDADRERIVDALGRFLG